MLSLPNHQLSPLRLYNVYISRIFNKILHKREKNTCSSNTDQLFPDTNAIQMRHNVGVISVRGRFESVEGGLYQILILIVRGYLS